MDLESLVQQAQAALENPVVVPCLIWAAVALFAVLFAYSLSKPKRKRGRTPSKAEGGTTYVEGVRRSTRCAVCGERGARRRGAPGAARGMAPFPLLAF